MNPSRAFRGAWLAPAVLGFQSSVGCSEPSYRQPVRVVYVDRPVEKELNLIEPIYWQPGLVVNRDDKVSLLSANTIERSGSILDSLRNL